MAKQTKTRDAELFIHRALTDQELTDFDAQGFLRMGRVLTDAGLQCLRDQCTEAWNVHKQGFDPDKNWLINSLLSNIHHHTEAVRDYYFKGPMVDAAVQLIGPNIKGATSQLTFKMRGNTLRFGWHQDNAYGELEPYNAISTLTALDDADVENGCLWVVPASHKQGQTDETQTEEDKKQRKDINLEVDDSKAVPLALKAGEALILHCWLLHKSEGNRSKDRDRRILFMRYADADAVEVYNDRNPRLGPLVRGRTRFPEVEAYEAELK